MKYTVTADSCLHAPHTSFADAVECLLAHARACANVGASCTIVDGFYLTVEEEAPGSRYLMFGVCEVIDLGEKVDLFDENSHIVPHPEVEERLAQNLFPTDEGEIRSLARAMGLLDKF